MRIRKPERGIVEAYSVRYNEYICVCVCLFSELVSLQEAFAAKKKQLTKAEQDMASITTKEESLSKHLKNVRLQVDEAKSALQAQQNRYY